MMTFGTSTTGYLEALYQGPASASWVFFLFVGSKSTRPMDSPSCYAKDPSIWWTASLFLPFYGTHNVFVMQLDLSRHGSYLLIL